MQRLAEHGAASKEAAAQVPCSSKLPPAVCLSSKAFRFGAASGGKLKLPLGPSIDYVHRLLQTAIEVEHSTIPLYLTTMYSIVNTTSFEYLTMRTIVMEGEHPTIPRSELRANRPHGSEMLHMVNAANVLNAVGGAPFFDHPSFIPQYPLVLPVLHMPADLVWFTQDSIAHFQQLESDPPGGYNSSISSEYLHIVDLLIGLTREHGEAAVFTGNHSFQVDARTSYGQVAAPVTSLENATAALMGVADQGGGCPVPGHDWPQTVNISAGPLGGEFSHAARYSEIIMGRSYQETDAVGHPTGAAHTIDYKNVRRFAPVGGKTLLCARFFCPEVFLKRKTGRAKQKLRSSRLSRTAGSKERLHPESCGERLRAGSVRRWWKLGRTQRQLLRQQHVGAPQLHTRYIGGGDLGELRQEVRGLDGRQGSAAEALCNVDLG